MPPFGLVSEYAGSPEAHAGFKVFVANDDRKGLAWMMVLHQGSGSPKRGTVRFHSLETWLFRRRDGRMLAHTRQMADFGDAVPNCPGANPRGAWRLLPGARLPRRLRGVEHHPRRGRRVRRAPRLRHPQRDHAVRPGEPRRGDLQQGHRSAEPTRRGGGRAARATAAACCIRAGTSHNHGSSRFRTDAYGRRAGAGLLQVVSSRVRVDQRRERHGVENAFIAEQPSDGGIYRAGRGLRPRRGFEFPGYCVIRTN